jgi:hypothetical protein
MDFKLSRSYSMFLQALQEGPRRKAPGSLRIRGALAQDERNVEVSGGWRRRAALGFIDAVAFGAVQELAPFDWAIVRTFEVNGPAGDFHPGMAIPLAALDQDHVPARGLVLN